MAKLELRNLPFYANAIELVVADTSLSGLQHRLTCEAASAWKRLKKTAMTDGVRLIIISAYRSFERQQQLIEARINSGECVNNVLTRLAPPGYSQHHTGCAVDIGTLDCQPAVEEFENTEAFAWLKEHAINHGFVMSYPKENEEGFDYEPWHWYFCRSPVAGA